MTRLLTARIPSLAVSEAPYLSTLRSLPRPASLDAEISRLSSERRLVGRGPERPWQRRRETWRQFESAHLALLNDVEERKPAVLHVDLAGVTRVRGWQTHRGRAARLVDDVLARLHLVLSPQHVIVYSDEDPFVRVNAEEALACVSGQERGFALA